jgi:hypothetical protein
LLYGYESEEAQLDSLYGYQGETRTARGILVAKPPGKLRIQIAFRQP